MKRCNRINKTCFFGQGILEMDVELGAVRFRFPEEYNENWIIFGRDLFYMFPPIGGWSKVNV